MTEERVRTDQEREAAQRREHNEEARPPKRAERPAPGVKHVPEPDAENIMPAEDEPGTL